MYVSKIITILGLAFVVSGCLLLYQHYSPRRLSFQNFKGTTFSQVQYKSRIVIPSINIDLEIFSAKIIDNKWDATTQGISHLSSTPSPGEKGNSVLYGHNWTSLLGNLTKIKPGTEIDIIFKNNDKKTFVVEYITVVDPNATQILANTNDYRITLYTCTGFLDTKRFVVTAILKS